MHSARTRLILLATLVAALFVVPAAGATVTTTPYGGTTDPTTGGHGDLTTGVTYAYSNSTETVKRILIDTPAGGIGNPNAVPYAERCTTDQFEDSLCPASSQIGVVTISATAWLGIIPIPMNNMVGTISQMQTTPEVPTIVGAYVKPPIGSAIRSYAKFYPVTSGPEGDFRIRTETSDFPTTGSGLPIQITKYEQKLFGRLANGNTFITNPTRCDTWMSGGYAEFYNATGTPDSDPLMNGNKTFFKSEDVPTTPDCDTLAPFNVAASATGVGGDRGGHAAFNTTLKIDGLGGEPQGSAAPKSVVATLPKALTIDVAQLSRVCSNEDFAASSCPASTQVGTVAIGTPMIADGLQGEAFLVKASPGRNLPDLGIRVHGAINFNLRGTNKFVNISQIQTTFDDLPQVGFSTFSLDLAGGNNGLLLVRKCPTDGSDPLDSGPTHFSITSYQGQTIETNSPSSYSAAPCINYSVSLKSAKKCVKQNRLKVRPTIKAPGEVRFVKYSLGKKHLKKAKRAPFSATLKLPKKLKAGKTYRYKMKVYYKPSSSYPNGRVISKTAKFKLCK